MAAASPARWGASFATLSVLTELTQLRVSVLEMEMAPCVIGAIAAIPAARELSIDSMDADDLGSLMQLTAATQLTKLDVDAMQFEGGNDDGGFQFVCRNQVRGCMEVVCLCVRVLIRVVKHVRQQARQARLDTCLFPINWQDAQSMQGSTLS